MNALVLEGLASVVCLPGPPTESPEVAALGDCAPILDAVRAYDTVGEMCDALREVWGEYEEVPII